VRSPKHNALQEPVSWSQAGHGLALFTDGSSCFRVWAPHATSVTLQVCSAITFACILQLVYCSSCSNHLDVSVWQALSISTLCYAEHADWDQTQQVLCLASASVWLATGKATL
jgi:hypothetical protein